MSHKTLISWSSGKDSAWLVHTIRTTMPEYDVSALLTTINLDANILPAITKGDSVTSQNRK